MTKTFLFAGGLIFLVLGLLHGHMTIAEMREARTLSPVDPALRAAMTTARLRLHDDLKMWDAWIGFNLSHSLGLVLFGSIVMVMTAQTPQPIPAAFSSVAFILVGSVYTALAIRFWFWVPAAGTAIGTACLALACLPMIRS